MRDGASDEEIQRLMQELVEGCDTVFHMAALRITQCAAEPRRAIEVMVDATYDLLEQCVAQKVRKVVVASSASVYGMAERFPTREDHHGYDNRTLYGAAKMFGEGLLRSFNDMYGLKYVALRYFNVYGARMDMHGAYTEVLIRWMDRILAGQPPLIFGTGTDTMDFVYVDDIARAYMLAMESDASDQVFNVASGVETSLNDLAHSLLKVMNATHLKPEYGPARKVNPVSRRLSSTKAAEEVLGFKATIDVEEGLRRLVAWWREEKSKAAA